MNGTGLRVTCIALILSSFLLAQANAPAPAKPAVKAAAQTAKLTPPAQKDGTPIFSAGTQLVLVPVVVTGKDAKHLSGLKRDAFEVREEGKSRAISIFEEKKQVPASLAGINRSAKAPAAAEDIGMTAVLFDMLSTNLLDQSVAQKMLIDHLSKSAVRDQPTAVYTVGRDGLKQLTPFTKDAAPLLAAVRGIKPEMSRSELDDRFSAISHEQTQVANAALAGAGPGAAGENATLARMTAGIDRLAGLSAVDEKRDTIRRTLRALRLVAHDFQGSPGRKTLIWASGGFPFRIDDPAAFDPIGSDMLVEYEATWRALMRSEVVVYSVGLAGLQVGLGYDAGVKFPGSGVYGFNEQQESLHRFAEVTGGVACVNTNGLEDCVKHAIDDSQQYYLLGYYLPVDDMKPGWRKLKVKVSVEGANVRAREGFYVPGPVETDPKKLDQKTVAALKSPDDYSGLRLSVKEVPVSSGTKPPSAGKSWREFMVGIYGDSLLIDFSHENALDVTVTSVAVDAKGKNGGETQKHLTAKLPNESVMKLRNDELGVRQTLELQPGKYDLRVVVRDNLSGQIGTIQYPVVVR